MNEEILINKTELKLLLEKRAKDMKYNIIKEAKIAIIRLTLLLMSTSLDYESIGNISPDVAKCCVVCAWVAFNIYGFAMAAERLMGKYNHQKLFLCIEALNKSTKSLRNNEQN